MTAFESGAKTLNFYDNGLFPRAQFKKAPIPQWIHEHYHEKENLFKLEHLLEIMSDIGTPIQHGAQKIKPHKDALSAAKEVGGIITDQTSFTTKLGYFVFSALIFIALNLYFHLSILNSLLIATSIGVALVSILHRIIVTIYRRMTVGLPLKHDDVELSDAEFLDVKNNTLTELLPLMSQFTDIDKQNKIELLTTAISEITNCDSNSRSPTEPNNIVDTVIHDIKNRIRDTYRFFHMIKIGNKSHERTFFLKCIASIKSGSLEEFLSVCQVYYALHQSHLASKEKIKNQTIRIIRTTLGHEHILGYYENIQHELPNKRLDNSVSDIDISDAIKTAHAQLCKTNNGFKNIPKNEKKLFNDAVTLIKAHQKIERIEKSANEFYEKFKPLIQIADITFHQGLSLYYPTRPENISRTPTPSPELTDFTQTNINTSNVSLEEDSGAGVSVQ